MYFPTHLQAGPVYSLSLNKVKFATHTGFSLYMLEARFPPSHAHESATMQLQRATLHIIGTNTPCSFWLLPWEKSINFTSLIIHAWVGPISYSRFSYLHCKQAHTQHRNILHVFTVTILLIYLFIYLFVCLFVCLFVYFFLLGGNYHAHQALNMFVI